MLEKDSLVLLEDALATLNRSFQTLPEYQDKINPEAFGAVLQQVAERLQDNYPYHHPFYIGQMLKPPHPIARLAYMLALWINPNNHALDGGRASSRMEREAVAQIAKMFQWESHLGHLTGGGTMANMEALWVSGKLHPDKKIVASAQAHYTHSRITEVLKIPFESIPVNRHAQMDIEALKARLDKGDVGTVVVTLGTTATGSIDPLPEILQLQADYGFRIHADCAYGGYFTLAANLSEYGRAAYDALPQVDSIVIDPHKHGLQPYGCGCVLFKDPSVGQFYKHDSPYTYFSSDELHLGEISLECSRAGASAVALWATMELYPLSKTGDFAANLSQSRSAALDFYQRLQTDERFISAFEPELDIVIFAPRATSASAVSELSRHVFNTAAELGLHLALTNQSQELLGQWWTELDWNQPTVACLRTCLMKPEHLDWMPQIWDTLSQAFDQVLARKIT